MTRLTLDSTVFGLPLSRPTRCLRFARSYNFPSSSRGKLSRGSPPELDQFGTLTGTALGVLWEIPAHIPWDARST